MEHDPVWLFPKPSVAVTVSVTVVVVAKPLYLFTVEVPSVPVFAITLGEKPAR